MKHKLIRKEIADIKGVHTFNFFEYHKEQDSVLRKIGFITKTRQSMNKIGLLTDSVQSYLDLEFQKCKKLLAKFQTRQVIVHNKIVNNGLNVFASRLSGSSTFSAQINYTALGTNSTAVSATDSQLGTEVYRKALSSGTFLNNIAFVETFFNPTEVTGTFEEYGNFIDGNAGADTGVLFNRFTQTVSKSNTESLNILSQITFNDV